MKRFVFMVLLFCSVCLFCGCAARQAFILPRGMRSSTQQMLVAEATEEAFKTLDLSDLQGKKVYLEVNALSERDGEKSPEETYIDSHLENELLKVGAVIVPEESGADMGLVVNVTAGADFYHRRVLTEAILYTDLTKGGVSYKAILYKLPDKKIISMKEGKAEEEYKETYILFGIIGPFH